MSDRIQASVPVAGKVSVFLFADGRVQAQCEMPSREILRMVLAKAAADLEMQMYAQEQAAKVQPAPAGIDLSALHNEV